jgi:N6-L-threonylcarbamoyladenine synthase
VSVYLLGIETSCDETSVAVVRLPETPFGPGSPLALLSDVTARQEEVHERFGGVVPELASRKHLDTLLPVVKTALERAGIGYRQLGAVAVTTKPGLIGSLLIGVNGAKTLCYGLKIPLIPVNHLEAHLAAITLEGKWPNFPCLALLVSGGHTSLFRVEEGFQNFHPVAHTRDDAAGEAFDKGARLLGLPYPGGPALAKVARGGKRDAEDFPRALPASLEFSFSGLKTALTYRLQSSLPWQLADLAASYEEAIVDVLVKKTLRALREGGYRQLLVAGGVAANLRLREKLQEALPKGCELLIPPVKFCTDNGAMIAALGALRWQQGSFVEGSDLFSVAVSPATEAKLSRGKKK